jgi:hypothetical protein
MVQFAAHQGLEEGVVSRLGRDDASGGIVQIEYDDPPRYPWLRGEIQYC